MTVCDDCKYLKRTHHACSCNWYSCLEPQIAREAFSAIFSGGSIMAAGYGIIRKCWCEVKVEAEPKKPTRQSHSPTR